MELLRYVTSQSDVCTCLKATDPRPLDVRFSDFAVYLMHNQRHAEALQTRLRVESDYQSVKNHRRNRGTGEHDEKLELT